MRRQPAAHGLALLLACGLLQGAALLAGEASGVAGQKVVLLAAASTADAVAVLADRFQEKTGAKIRVATGGSNGLARQILAGAPADLFLSANEQWAQAVRKAELSRAMRPLLRNELVIVVPRGNPAGVHSPRDLLHTQVRHVALAGETVPAGIYAEQCLRASGVYDVLALGRRIARGHDVRLTLGYVETGEAQAGVVYRTDAHVSDRVSIVHHFDPATHRPVLYPLLLLRNAAGNEAAALFYEYLFSGEARDVFRTFGFGTCPPDRSE